MNYFITKMDEVASMDEVVLGRGRIVKACYSEAVTSDTQTSQK